MRMRRPSRAGSSSSAGAAACETPGSRGSSPAPPPVLAHALRRATAPTVAARRRAALRPAVAVRSCLILVIFANRLPQLCEFELRVDSLGPPLAPTGALGSEADEALFVAADLYVGERFS